MQQQRKDSDDLFFLPSLVMPEVTAYIRLAYAIVTTILGWISLTIEVFLRYNFGERYFSIIRAFMAMQVAGLYFLICTLLKEADPQAPFSTDAFSGFLVVFIGLAAIHLLAIRIRRWRGVMWHSRSFGVSWFSFLLWRWDWLFYRFIEPGAVFILGYVVYHNIDQPLGLWLCLASVALAMKNNLSYLMELERMFDMIDPQIEQAHMQEAMQGANKSKTAGFSVVRIPSKMAAQLQPMDTVKTVGEAMRQAELVASQSGN